MPQQKYQQKTGMDASRDVNSREINFPGGETNFPGLDGDPNVQV